jgi:hypothetical protein
VVVPGNGGFLVVFLLKTLSGDWTFSRVKTYDLIRLVRPDDDSVHTLIHRYLAGGVVMENPFRSLGVVTGRLLRQCLYFFLFFLPVCILDV